MNTTPNLGLKKPLQTEFYNVDDFNYNSDTIDQAIHDLSENKQDKLSTSQLNAVDSGITAAKVAKLDALPTSTQLDGSLSSKANKSDITNISITGTTNNTGSTILAGTLFYLNGTLCKTLVGVADGATFTEGTNYTRFYVNNFVKRVISVKKNDFTLPTNYTDVLNIAIPAHSCYAINGYIYALTGKATGIYIDYTGNISSQMGALAIREDANGVYSVSYCGYNSQNYPVNLHLIAKGVSNTTVNAEFNGWYEFVD